MHDEHPKSLSGMERRGTSTAEMLANLRLRTVSCSLVVLTHGTLTFIGQVCNRTIVEYSEGPNRMIGKFDVARHARHIHVRHWCLFHSERKGRFST